MPRSSPDERLDGLLRAATRVFARKGFRRTQMSDVAGELGVSVGSLYTYVESKEALFHHCLAAASPVPATASRRRVLPLRTPAPRATKKVVDDGMAAIRGGTVLEAALAVDHPADIAQELRAIIGDFYDRTAASRRFQALVEGSAEDMPELFEAFFVRSRRVGLDALAIYLQRRIDAGFLRPVPDVATAARLINETQAWFSRHRRGDPDAGEIDDDLARETVIDVLVAGFVPTVRA